MNKGSGKLRRFALLGLLGVAALVVMQAAYFRWLALQEMEQLSISAHQVLARTLSASVRHHILPALDQLSTVPSDKIREVVASTQLDRYLAEPLKGMRVVRIKIYSLDRIAVYSTEPSQIGEVHDDNAGVISALNGNTAAELIHRDTFNTTDGTIEDRDLLETYVPMRSPVTGKVEGVFEIYSDLTPVLEQIDRTQRNVTLGSLLMSVIVFGFMFVIYRSSDAALQREQADSARLMGELEDARSSLEERVESRTRALSESEQRFRDTVDSVIDGIVVADETGLIEMVNPAAEALFGYPAAELNGKNVDVLMPEPYRSEHAGYIRRYLKGGQPGVIGTPGREVQGLRKDGDIFPLELSVGKSRHDDSIKFVGVLRDLSIRKEAERQLEAARQRSFHNEKMASIGQLAAGIIHEVGNPVAAISGAVDTIRRHYQSEPDTKIAGHDATRENIELITRQIERLSNLTREISEFASPKVSEHRLMDINQLARDSVNLLRFEPRWSSTKVNLTLGSNVPAIKGSADQLTQVVFNLLVNAADACEQAEERESRIEVSTRLKGNQVCLFVTDNGCGMDETVKARAFEPFFSTKPQGRGIGLGLGICQEIVGEHGGTCQIESELNRGTTVAICLPIGDGIKEQVP
jgi:two-component system sensor kinase FixL